MAWHDITRPLHPGMTVFPGDPPFLMSVKKHPADGGTITLSELSMGSHCGTHLDAPLHFIEDGDGVDRIGPEAVCGPCRVVEVSAGDTIAVSDVLAGLADGTERILFKTDDTPENGRITCLTEEAAALLVAKGCRLVGLEAMSADSADAPGFPVHRKLLAGGTVILESIDLSGIKPGSYELICCPLRIAGGDGAPTRVYLRD